MNSPPVGKGLAWLKVRPVPHSPTNILSSTSKNTCWNAAVPKRLFVPRNA
jgi:hypothetical protein